MKKTTSTKKETLAKQFEDVTVRTGPLAGMVFVADDHTPVVKGKVKIRYIAPDNGPRTIVEHYEVQGKFDPARKAEDVRLAFAKLLPANILWSAETGYSDRKSGTALKWSHQLARFVVNNEQPAPKSVEEPEITEETGED